MWENIKIKTETKNKLDIAKQEYLKHHKELEGANISYNHIVTQIVNYYLEH